MPRIESELRSRDLYQLLAEPTITEDPPPTSITLELPRLLTDSDTLVLTEEFDYFDSINSGVYKVAAPNLLVSPDYEAEADWDLDEDADHTVGITEDRSEFFLRGRTLFSAEIDLTASAGVGETTLQQAIDEVIGSVSGEVWVNLHEVSGAVIRLQLQALGAGESVVDSSTVDELSAATTGWERLAVEDYSPPSTSVQVQWSAPAGDARSPTMTCGIEFKEVRGLS